MTIKCVSLFPRESCLPMLPCVYLWMKMTLETPCTPLPQQQHIFLSFHGLYREWEKKVKWKYKVVFKDIGFIISLQLEPGASPNVLFKFAGQAVHIWGAPSIGTVFYSYKYNNQTNHQISKQLFFLSARNIKASCTGYATVNNFTAVEHPHAAPHSL